MYVHPLQRWLVLLACVAYSTVGVFGHALHALLPCEGGAASSAVVRGCVCGCHHEPPRALADVDLEDGAAWRTAGHDADDCSLCALLAQIKIGRAAPIVAVEIAADVAEKFSSTWEAAFSELHLARSPRGPPVC